MGYIDVTDNELLYLIRSENQQAKELLINRYKKRIFGMIDCFSKKNSMRGLDYEEYFHNCFIVFLKCVENFDEDYNFYGYVSQSIERELLKLLNKENEYRKILSLDDDLVLKDKVLMDVVSDTSLIYKANEIKEYIEENFDNLGKVIVKYRLEGYNSNEIAKLLGINKKTVYKKLKSIQDSLKTKR